MKSAYIEFVREILEESTSFRLFLNGSHLFLHISQDGPGTKFFSEMLEKNIVKRRLYSKQKKTIFCVLKDREHFNIVTKIITDVLLDRSEAIPLFQN